MTNLIYDGEAFLYRLLGKFESDKYLKYFKENINWKQNEYNFNGRIVKSPRLVAWYGDKNYTYSGITNKPNDWTPKLLELKNLVERKSKGKFNSVLLNWYRNENDSISWHSDAEKELGKELIIASVSLGEEREFLLKHRRTKETRKINLYSGSLLLMRGKTQEKWQHAIEKAKTKKADRINLTFRWIHD